MLAFIGLQPFVKVSDLTRDVSTINGGKFYYGFLSSIGILLWCSTATICLAFTYLLFKMNIKINAFVFCAGLLTTMLLFDDLFLIHEYVAPKRLGISEEIVKAIYPSAILLFLIFFREQIFSSSYFVFLSSLGFLALSIVIDSFIPQNMPHQYLFEDGFKFMGIVGWFYYLSSTCYTLSKNTLVKQNQEEHMVINQ
ncbi:hypothetical protein [Pontibacter fetidus]|uniref:Uncharacterized protein n=1 Tax=Pontibacter fetidus TaxID=2700082 RepID=A0A6B2GVS1_9BACT|nr:hypothetical protein [Pontibacter fetidus]NDK55009.1 hypothetical protein [Pontibacter fetidus]